MQIKKPYDPKLREAADEFRAICKKYDCMAACLFVSPSHAEFVNELSPSWSVMKYEGEKQIRFRSKKEDFPSREAQHHATEATAHGITSIVNWTRQQNAAWSGILLQLQQKAKIFYGVWNKPDSVPGDGQ